MWLSFSLLFCIFILFEILVGNRFYSFWKSNQALLLSLQTVRSSYWYFTTMIICINVFILVSKYLLLNTGSLSNPFLIMLLIFSHILLYFFDKFSSWTKQNMVLAISKFLTYPNICRSLIVKGVTVSSILYPTKIFNPFFHKNTCQISIFYQYPHHLGSSYF